MKILNTSKLIPCKGFRHKTLSDRVTIQVIALLSIISSLTTLITFLIIFSSNQSWFDVRDYVLHWMTDNNIDINATRKVSSILTWISNFSTLVNSIFILATCLHIIFSCLLYLGSKPSKPKLRIPWLVTHMIIIIITTITFICWTFITFFIDLLVTIVFPVLSGLILGVSILLWRLIYNIHNNYKTAGDELDVSDIKIGSK